MKSIQLSMKWLIVLCFAFSCSEVEETINVPSIIKTEAELTEVLEEVYASSEAPGFALAIVKSGELVYSEAFGQSDLNSGGIYSTQTVQPIGSISKTFVAAAIVKAIEEGYFTLDTPINELLPVDVLNPKTTDAKILIKHLVTHTSGLIDNLDYYLPSYYILPDEDLSTEGASILMKGLGFQQRQGIPLDEYLSDYYLPDGVGYDLSNFSNNLPGQSWNYSNIATSLAALIVESSVGISFDEYVQMKVLQPLRMNHTSYLMQQNAATLYWDKNIPLPAYANDSYPDGSVCANLEDMTMYLTDMMQGAKGNSTTLFSTESYEILFEPLLTEDIVPSELGANQGVFWFLGEGGIIRHDGSDPGTTCVLEFNQNADVGFVLLTNMDASTDEHQQAFFLLTDRISKAISAYLN